MRPDDRARWLEVGTSAAEVADGAYEGPMDVDLEPVDASLRTAGAHARLALRSRTQPTRYFETELRHRLVASFAPPAESR